MTNVQIVNLALSKLGSSLITSLGDASVPGSHHGGLLYEPTLKTILREFLWSFAKEEMSLPQLPEALSKNWRYSYALPASFVRISKLVGTRNDNSINDFSRTKTGIHCNESTVTLEFISSDLNPSDFDDDFRNAFVVLLASELAAPILQNPKRAQSLMQDYASVYLPKAKTVDARETESNENYGITRAILNSPLNQARRSCGGYYPRYD